MNVSLLIVGLLPLLFYLAMDAWKGYRAGILAAIACTIVMVGYTYFMFGEIDNFIIGEGIMIVVLGCISLKMNNDRYFKFQPTLLAVIFAGVFAWFQLFDQPLMLHFIPHVEKILSPDALKMNALPRPEAKVQNGDESSPMNILHSDQFKKALSRLSGHMIWLFLAHALIMTYAALRLRTRGWFAWRMTIYPAIFALVVINQLLV
jgi:intracellular septation protein A